MKSYKTTAMFIKARRRKLGITQGKIAKHLQYNTQYVSNMERGLCGVPAHKAKRLASILKVRCFDISYRMFLDYQNEYLKKMKRGRK